MLPIFRRPSLWRTLALLTGFNFVIQLAFVDFLILPGTTIPLHYPWTGFFLLDGMLLGWHVTSRLQQNREWADGRFVFLFSVLVYLSNFRWEGMDNLPTSLLPFAILQDHTLYLDRFASWFEGVIRFNIVATPNGHWVSFYPILGAILALPVYLIPALRGVVIYDHVLHQLEKISASLICAAAVLVMYQIYRRTLPAKRSVQLALLFAFGTTLLSLACQALWQYAADALILTLTMWALLRTDDDKKYWIWCGALATLTIAARSSNAIYFLAFLSLSVFLDGWKGFMRFALGVLPAGLLCELYYGFYVGTGRPAEFGFQQNLMSWPPKLEAIVGQLVSPSRGLFLYSPIVLFALWGLFRDCRGSDMRAQRRGYALSMAMLVNLLLLGCYKEWHGALAAFGPRYMFEATVILFTFLPRIQERLSGSTVKKAWRIACIWSVLCHGIGAYGKWDLKKIGPYVTPWTLTTHPFVAKPLKLLGVPLVKTRKPLEGLG